MDDLDFPTFEAPPRHASRPAPPRPATSRPVSSRRAAPRALPEPIEDVFEDLGRAAPRPKTRQRASASGRLENGARSNRPQTSRPAPRPANAAPRATTAS